MRLAAIARPLGRTTLLPFAGDAVHLPPLEADDGALPRALREDALHARRLALGLAGGGDVVEKGEVLGHGRISVRGGTCVLLSLALTL